jgi:hypothetical protein
MKTHPLTVWSALLTGLILIIALQVVSFRLEAAEISVDLDSKQIEENQSVKLIYSADSATESDPDFSPLQKDFDIVNQSSSSQLTMINGSVTRNYRWTLTVIPKKTGKLTIPAISFGSDSSPVSVLQVNAAQQRVSGQAAGEVFLEVEVIPKDPYVQAQVSYTVRVFHKVGISQASLSPPAANNVVIEQLHKDRQYRTRYGNQNYDVFERRYTIFPESSGKLVIPPIQLDAQVLTGQTTGGLFSRNVTHSQRFVSNAVELNVKPIPDSFTGKHWLPASSVQLTQTWSEDPAKTMVGEPITQTLALQIEGLMKSQLPALSTLLKNTMANTDIKTYPDQPKLTQAATANGVTSRREEKIAMIPGKSGTFKLPTVELPWWNVETDRMEIARIDAVVLQAKGSGKNTVNSPINIAPESTANNQTDASSFSLNDDFQQNSGFWKWVSLILGLGWLLTLLGFSWFLYSRKKNGQSTTETPNEESQRLKAGRNLRKACQDNNPVHAKTEFLKWAHSRWLGNPPTNLAEIGKRLPALKEVIDQLENNLYNSEESQWDGELFWKQFKAHRRDNNIEGTLSVNQLEPLFKA